MMLLPRSRLPYTFAPAEPAAQQNFSTGTLVEPLSPSIEPREHYRSPLFEASEAPAPPPCIDPRNEGSFHSITSGGFKFAEVVNCESEAKPPICDVDNPFGSRVSVNVRRCSGALKRKRAVTRCLSAENEENATCFPESILCSKKMKYAPEYHDSDQEMQQPRRQGQSLGRKAVQILKDWMFAPENVDNPYPTHDEKLRLSAEAGITQKQLCNWFVNSRKRLWAPVHEERAAAIAKDRTSLVCKAPVGDRNSLEQKCSSPLNQSISNFAHGISPTLGVFFCNGDAEKEQRFQAACGLLTLIPLFNAGVAQMQLSSTPIDCLRSVM